jgi:uroporphyrinogen-III synthase
MNAHPVQGKRVLVTRAVDDAERWAARLAAIGATPVIFPCLVSEPMDDHATRETFADALRNASWLVVTSRRGAEVAGALARQAGITGYRVAAVGRTTATAAQRHLQRVDLVASAGTGAILGRELVERIKAGTSTNESVLVAGALGGREDVMRVLSAASITVKQIAIYRTVPAPLATKKQDLAQQGIDVVLLASPTAVTGLLHRAFVPAGAQVITIGPTTTRAATAAGLAVFAQARYPSLDGILEAIA